jgi:hypothetical protein
VPVVKISRKKEGLLVTRNNVLGLLYYFLINIIIYSLSFFIDDYLYNMEIDYLNLIFQTPIFLVAICMLVLTGRYFLTNQGSKMKNVFSVSLIAILGIPIAVQDLFVSNDIDPYVLYWAYTTPLGPLYEKMGIGFHGILGFVLWCTFSIVPSGLMWLGIQWKVKSLHNDS